MNFLKGFTWAIILVVLSLVLGFFIGKYSRVKGLQLKTLRSGQNKINEAFDIISQNYVDTVDINLLAERAVEKIISELDPHSSYIPASDVDMANEDLESSFGGIGIHFDLQTDTIIVIEVVSGGPAEKAGLMSFDRVIKVNDTIVAGQNINSNAMMRMLRGPKNSKVTLGVLRGNATELTDFELTRGDIPNYSIDASFNVSDEIGYIKVKKFARSTYNEFLTAIAKLKNEGAKGFIIDLRDNPGGYMESAIYMINEFLSKGQLIVYMEGRAYSRSDIPSTGKGSCQDAPLIVLIDEFSGSASEIFAGAIQDNDRGLIIGRRSFGKGLIQTKLDFMDSSELLLTIARYYTPSGRCIQKEYTLGNSEEYSMDILNRYRHGEFFSADSIKMIDSLEYKTIGGRAVYGGGGIMPDIFIPRDTAKITSYYSNLINSNALYLFTIDYSSKNQDKLKQFKSYTELHNYLKQQPLIDEMADFAESRGVRKRPTLMEISKELIETQIYALIVRNFFDYNGYFPIILKDDPVVNKAVEVIKKDIWKPEVYVQNNNVDDKPLHSVYIPVKNSENRLRAAV